MESAHRCVCKLPLVSAFISKMCEINPACISLFKPQHILHSYAVRRLLSTSCRPQFAHLAWGSHAHALRPRQPPL